MKAPGISQFDGRAILAKLYGERREMGQWIPPRTTPRVRNGALAIFLSVVTIGLYGLYIFFIAHREHARRQGRDPRLVTFLALVFPPALIGITCLFAAGYRLRVELEPGVPLLGWVGIVLTAYSHVAAIVVEYKLSFRLQALLRLLPTHQEEALSMGALSAAIMIALMMTRQILPILHGWQAITLPEFYFSSAAQAAMRGLSLGLVIPWYVSIFRAANRLARSVAELTR